MSKYIFTCFFTSGAKAIATTGCVCCLSVCTQRKTWSWTSQTLTEASNEPVASSSGTSALAVFGPVLLQPKQVTPFVCKAALATQVSDETLHNLTVLSSEHEARSLPWGHQRTWERRERGRGRERERERRQIVLKSTVGHDRLPH